MSSCEEKIRHLILKADLNPEEVRRLDNHIAGRIADDTLVREAEHLIRCMMLDRRDRDVRDRFSPSYLEHFINDERSLHDQLHGKWKDDKVKDPGKPPLPNRIEAQDAYLHSSDSTPRCNHCGISTPPTYVGDLVLDGCPRPAYKCASCSRVFSDLPSGVKVLMDVAMKYGAESVGFKPADGNAPAPAAYNHEAYETNNKLNQVNSNLSVMSSAIDGLVEEIRRLAQQNHELMDKLARDPLVSVRKQVAEFNLR